MIDEVEGGKGDVVRERGNSFEYWEIKARSGRDLWIEEEEIGAGDWREGMFKWWGEFEPVWEER